MRAGAPAGSSIGRVAAADLEREVTAALQAGREDGANGRAQVDETGARVALTQSIGGHGSIAVTHLLEA